MNFVTMSFEKVGMEAKGFVLLMLRINKIPAIAIVGVQPTRFLTRYTNKTGITKRPNL